MSHLSFNHLSLSSLFVILQGKTWLNKFYFIREMMCPSVFSGADAVWSTRYMYIFAPKFTQMSLSVPHGGGVSLPIFRLHP